MFTGLVETKGLLHQREPMPFGVRLTILSALVSETSGIGDSLSVNGCCLTIVDSAADRVTMEAGLETLSRTNLGQLRSGDEVNLERSLKIGDLLGGHFVTGHIDCLGTVRERVDDASWCTMHLEIPAPWDRHVASKGSIAVDGVSLTVVDVANRVFTVALIPHTLQHTTLGKRRIGDLVNLETDILAKYVERSLPRGP